MKLILPSLSLTVKGNRQFPKLILSLLLTGLSLAGNAQSFSTCTGQTVLSITGPNSSTITNYTGSAVTVQITAKGGGGGSGYSTATAGERPGGEGATIIGEFTMQPGETIRAIAGGQGEHVACLPTCSSNVGGGGGGGSGAVNCGNPSDCANGTILLIAGAARGGYDGGNSGLGGSATLTNCGTGGGTSGARAGAGGGCSSSGANSSCAGGGGQVSNTGLSSGGAKCSTCADCGNGADGMGGGGGGSTAHGGGGGGGDQGGTGGAGAGVATSYNIGTNQSNTGGATASNSANGMVEIVCLSLMPVELTSFKAIIKDNQVSLTWQTGSEVDNQGFEIQKSMNGADWATIGFVEGKGTASELNTYHYSDRHPQLGINYYRLRQMDFDGRFEFSKTVSIKMEPDNSSLALFPNPATKSMSLALITGYSGAATFNLYDSMGRKVKTRLLMLEGEPFRLDIGLEALPAGVYLAEVRTGRDQWQERLVVN